MKTLKLIAKIAFWVTVGLLFLFLDLAFMVRDVPGGEWIWNCPWLHFGAWTGLATVALVCVKNARHVVMDIAALSNLFRRKGGEL